MGLLEDVMKTLERIPLWKRLKAIPLEVDELKQRVEELEDKLGSKWPADVCKACGEKALRLQNSTMQTNIWRCESCGTLEFRKH